MLQRDAAALRTIRRGCPANPAVSVKTPAHPLDLIPGTLVAARRSQYYELQPHTLVCGLRGSSCPHPPQTALPRHSQLDSQVWCHSHVHRDSLNHRKLQPNRPFLSVSSHDPIPPIGATSTLQAAEATGGPANAL